MVPKSWSKDMKVAERMEREEKAAGRSYGAAYLWITGPAPACAPGDTDAASGYLSRIMKAITVGHWTRSEWGRLYKLRDKWSKRASGVDKWFNVFGTKQVPGHEETIERLKEDAAIRDSKDQILKILKMADEVHKNDNVGVGVDDSMGVGGIIDADQEQISEQD